MRYISCALGTVLLDDLAPQRLRVLRRPQKHVDQGQFPEFMPKDTIMQQHDWWVSRSWHPSAWLTVTARPASNYVACHSALIHLSSLSS